MQFLLTSTPKCNILCIYEGNVKEEQVIKLHAKVEALSKKVASLLQLLPKLAQRFDVNFQHVVDHVTQRRQQQHI
jgi:hypothetical protein